MQKLLCASGLFFTIGLIAACGDPPPPPVEDCSNAADDDGDGLIDCTDTDCQADPACQGGACGDGTIDAGEQCDPPDNLTCDQSCQSIPEAGHCNDGADNDQDGQLDCADADCAADPGCQPGVEQCANGLDDDGDGQTDCADADCQTSAACIVNGTSVVREVGLLLDDVSDDGTFIAFRNAAHTLFVVSTNGGNPLQVSTTVDSANFKGKFLTFFQGAQMRVVRESTLQANQSTVAFSANSVAAGSVRASDDGDHLFFETRIQGQEASLDGVQILSNALTIRGRFSPANNFLVVSTDEDDPLNPGNNTLKKVRAFPLNGGAPIILNEGDSTNNNGPSGRFEISGDGSQVVIAANEAGDVADLTLFPIGGGAGTPLVPQGSDNGFSFFDDGTTLAFLAPDDPLAPTTFSLHAISITGGAPSLIAANVGDVISTSNNALVYAPFVQGAVTAELRFINQDGSGDVSLALDAVDKGFTSDGAFYLFFDTVVSDALGNFVNGRLRTKAAAGATATVGNLLLKGSIVNTTQVVSLDTAGVLRIHTLTNSTAQVIQGSVSAFEAVPDALGSLTDSRAVFAIPAGGTAGIYITNL